MKLNFKKYETIEEQNKFEAVKFADEEMAKEYKQFMGELIMALIDKRKDYVSGEEYDLDSDHFEFEDVKEAVLDLKEKLIDDLRKSEKEKDLSFGKGAENQVNNTFNYIERIFGDFEK